MSWMWRSRQKLLVGTIFLAGWLLGYSILFTGILWPAEAEEVRFHVSQILTDSSEILSTEEIRIILEPLEGRELGVSDLLGAVEAINALYAKKGYVTAQALLPPQDVDAGTVYIQLVEGRLGRLTFEGNVTTTHQYLQDRISLTPGDLVRLDKLEEDILYFNQTNDVALHGQLAPGEEFGTTDITVLVAEPPRVQARVFADNAGRSESGRYRGGIALAYNSLFGFRDPVNLSLTKGKGSLAGSVSYDVPMNPKGFRTGLRFDGSSVKIVSGDFEDLEIESRSLGRTIYFTSPLRVEANRVVDGFLEYHWRTARSIFSGVELIKNQTGKVIAGWNIQRAANPAASSISHTITVGHGDAAVDKNFVKYYGSLDWAMPDSRGTEAHVRAAVQVAPTRLLPPEEQFAVGGMNSVRGFEEGQLTGDMGYMFSLEFVFPLAKALSGVFFFDHGAAFPYKGNDEPITQDDFLISTGVGVNIRLGNSFSGRFQLALPLLPAEDPRIHGAVQLAF